MSSHARILFTALAASLACGTAGAAEKATVGVSVNATVLTGIGLSVGTSLGEYFNVRGVGNGYSYSKDIEDDSGNYAGKVKLFSSGLLFDYQPFAGAFRLSVGLLSNGNKITLDGKPKNGQTFDIGDCSYVSDTASGDPLRVNGATNFKKMAPYAGIGWGGNMSSEPGFFATFDIGVMFSGDPNISLKAAGRATNADPVNHPECGANGASIDVASDPQVQAQVKKAEDDAADQAQALKGLWPAIGFGLGWRF